MSETPLDPIEKQAPTVIKGPDGRVVARIGVEGDCASAQVLDRQGAIAADLRLGPDGPILLLVRRDRPVAALRVEPDGRLFLAAMNEKGQTVFTLAYPPED